MEIDIVNDKEFLARIICSPLMIKQGLISPSAYTLEVMKSGDLDAYISVWRLGRKKPTKENVKFSPRSKGNTWVGYAKIKTKEVREEHYQDVQTLVTAEYKKIDNYYHAGIWYVLKNNTSVNAGVSMNPNYIKIAERLAKKSKAVLWGINR